MADQSKVLKSITNRPVTKSRKRKPDYDLETDSEEADSFKAKSSTAKKKSRKRKQRDDSSDGFKAAPSTPPKKSPIKTLKKKKVFSKADKSDIDESSVSAGEDIKEKNLDSSGFQPLAQDEESESVISDDDEGEISESESEPFKHENTSLFTDKLGNMKSLIYKNRDLDAQYGIREIDDKTKREIFKIENARLALKMLAGGREKNTDLKKKNSTAVV